MYQWYQDGRITLEVSKRTCWHGAESITGAARPISRARTRHAEAGSLDIDDLEEIRDKRYILLIENANN